MLQQRRNIFGSVLQVAIHREDHFTLRFMESGGERRGLPEVAAQSHHLQSRIRLDEIRQQFIAAVGRCIVNEQNLVGPPDCAITAVRRS